MRILLASLLLVAFVVIDGVCLSFLFGRTHGDGHFPSGTVTLPMVPASDAAAEAGRPRTFKYDVSSSTVSSAWEAIGPSGWGCSVQVDMSADINGDEFAWNIDDYQAATSIAAAQVYEKELLPRFGASAAGVRGKFIEWGSVHVVKPAAIPYVRSLLLYGVPLLQLAFVGWIACRRRK